ncbi:HpcH/HpaI aldolase/citrate lyase family protein [Arthrobacter sp. NPDC093139]|uniref:HpcH/HpaI aldolase/citrate lyase family protein n=1 Tax=Arthrobacter sp. NPDC093139 TaxID=3363945 RepID=UPI0037FB3F35
MSSTKTFNAESARSWLFVPATRPDRFPKAAESGTDIVILDLGDAVAPEDKADARTNAVNWLSEGIDHAAAVRVNDVTSDHYQDDIYALTDLPRLQAVILPMASDATVLDDLHRRLGPRVALIPQVETAAGILHAADLASAPGVVRLAFGHLDFAFDIDASPEPEAMAYARSALVLASRYAGVAGPIDSVTTDLDDADAASHAAIQARSLGFTGKLCIHPRQVPAVNEAMSPSSTEVAWAQRVLAASTGGAVRVDGQMVDAPVIARAERIIVRAG